MIRRAMGRPTRIERRNVVAFRSLEYFRGLRDLLNLHALLPQLRAYKDIRARYERRLLPYYREYVSMISSETMCISLELASFLLAICDFCRPRRVVDLGSGFSSVVLRL